MAYISPEQAEINLTCKAGIDSYLNDKHNEHIKAKIEDGLIGSAIGVIATLLFAQFVENTPIKPIHSLIPLGAGVFGGVVVGYTTYNKMDENHREDFKEVCGKYYEEDE